MIARHFTVEVSTAGELVVFEIGDQAFTLEFETALRVAGQMLLTSQAARRAAGVHGTNLRVGGLLSDDAEPSTYKQGRFEKLPPLVAKNQASCIPFGRGVRLKLGSSSMDMGWEAGLTISQWLRIRGKQARNNSGEKANWSKIAGMEQLH